MLSMNNCADTAGRHAYLLKATCKLDGLIGKITNFLYFCFNFSYSIINCRHCIFFIKMGVKPLRL